MCEVLLEFDDHGCLSSIKTTYCTNHPACCTLVGRLSRPVRVEFGHPQQFHKHVEDLSPKPLSSSSHHHYGGGSSPTTTASMSPSTALFGNITNSLNIPSPLTAAPPHRRHMSSRLLRTVSDVAQQSLKRSVSAPHSSPTPSPTRLPPTPTPITPRLDVTNPDSDGDYFFDGNRSASPFQATYQSPVPFPANYCICLTFIYRCGHPVDDLKPNSANGGEGQPSRSMKGKHMICGWVCSKEGQCRHTRITHTVQVPLGFGCRFVEPDCSSGALMDTTRLCSVGGGGAELKESAAAAAATAAGGGGSVDKGILKVLLVSQGDVWR
ncbi:hypothetical protein PG999_004824 [Apiospora kogelbergensis]|uniref:Uncharacterized protein n=1 Tax=Apiospora kogelbergensis TaxID=1337665 RepID=A0AAW0R0D2_9PEZI